MGVPPSTVTAATLILSDVSVVYSVWTDGALVGVCGTPATTALTMLLSLTPISFMA